MSTTDPAALIEAASQGSVLRVRVAPGASRERIVGPHGDALKVAVAAPPERGRANERVVALLAAAFELPVARLAVVAGATSRNKKVLVSGVGSADLCRRLAAILGNL